jgi:hypothetical protein
MDNPCIVSVEKGLNLATANFQHGMLYPLHVYCLYQYFNFMLCIRVIVLPFSLAYSIACYSF